MLPELPPEIEDQIFECAARMYAKYAPKLSVVSKRVQTCVERVIYKKLHFFPVRSELPWPRSAEVATIQHFKPTLLSRPAEFFATHVRSVIFQDNILYCSAKLVFEKCTALEHIAFFIRPKSPDMSSANPLILASAHTLQSLMTNQDVLNDMADSGIVCPRLRYLWIDVCCFTPMPALQWLPALHIVDLLVYNDPCIDDLWKDQAKTVLNTTQNLQVMGLYVHVDCLDVVESWIETVISPVRIDVRVYIPFGVVERWRMLASSHSDAMLDISDIRAFDICV